MELRVLRYFLTVVHEGSITAAAEVLHVTQPTLSRQLAQLERELGVQLYDRTIHGVELTGEGRLLALRAEELVELADKTESEVRHHSEGLTGTIYVGTGELRAERTLYRLAEGFRTMHPHVTFDIYSATSDTIKERMGRGLVDVGILVEPIELESFGFVRLGATEEWVATMRNGDRLASHDVIHPADLVGVPLILPRRTSMQSEVAHWFGGLFEQLEVVAHTNLVGSSTSMVREGMGVSLTSSTPNLDDPGAGLTVLPLDPPLRTSTLLAWRHELALGETARAFVDYAKGQLAGNGDAGDI